MKRRGLVMGQLRGVFCEKRVVFHEDSFAGGGTAGHINPALAIAGTVREHEPDAAVLYVGAKGGMEERLVPKAGLISKA